MKLRIAGLQLCILERLDLEGFVMGAWFSNMDGHVPGAVLPHYRERLLHPEIVICADCEGMDHDQNLALWRGKRPLNSWDVPHNLALGWLDNLKWSLRRTAGRR
jgi:hypothetical protein